MRTPRHLLEILEPRTLLSTVHATPPLSTHAKHAETRSHISTTSGTTFHLVTGTPFSGQLAFFPSPVLDPPLAFSATINWGDGASSTASLQYTTQNNVPGYSISGDHTYSKTGTFKITVILVEGPLHSSGQPTPSVPSRLVARFIDHAIVTPPITPPPVIGGVTINETAGLPFSANVGSFTAVVPAANLKASLDWGDGATSIGTLQPAGVTGIDTVAFNVLGSHTYASPGTFPIVITIYRAFPSPVSGPSPLALQVITTIDSTAIVAAANPVSLAGAITGTYTLAPFAGPGAPATASAGPVSDIGTTYLFTGSGTAGDLGQVDASASIHTPGFILGGISRGTLTLTNANGSVTLSLTSPVIDPLPLPRRNALSAPLPTLFSYQITSGTGAYANDTASGTLTITLTPATTNTGQNTFTFTLS